MPDARGIGGFSDGLPDSFLTVQRFRKSTLASASRIRLKEQARNYVIVRNLSPVNVAQIGFTTNTNDNRNPPASGFVDINPNEEWYETGSTNQIYYRPKVDAAEVLVEIEVSVPI